MEPDLREWKWCLSKEQRTCPEVCARNLQVGKCIRTKGGCKVRPEPMSEEARLALRAYGKHGQHSPSGSKTPELCDKLKRMAARKASTMLYKEKRTGRKFVRFTVLRDISESTVRHWIDRGNVPERYRGAVLGLWEPLSDG